MRIVVLGPGAAGKSTFARELGQLTGVEAVELDKVFWSRTLEPLPPDVWVDVQMQLVAADSWILDGDLGRNDVLRPRLERADTVVVFDPPLLRCVWRALRRSRERADFWVWLLTWRRREKPRLLAAIERHAPDARTVFVASDDNADRAARDLARVARRAAPTLHLLCGLPGSGKTTRARELEAAGQGVLLNADEWVWRLYPDDAEAAARDERKDLVEQVQWELVERFLTGGISVILDWGVWMRAERDHYRSRARDLGATVRTVFVDAPIETLHERVAQRNLDLPPGTFHISAEELDEWSALFEPPTAEELAGQEPGRGTVES